MQFIEFFIWRNINNKFYNHIFSICATFLIILQPMISLMILTNIKLRNLLLVCYLLLAIPYSIYKFFTKNIHTVVSEKKHLRWIFFELSPFIFIIWLFFFLFRYFYEKKYFGIIFAFITLVIAFINYKNDYTVGSMWCWSVNSIMIYYSFYLLIYLPFLEKNKIC